MDGATVDRLVTIFFSGTTAQYGPYHPPGNKPLSDARKEIIRNTLYRYDLVDGDSRPVTLQLYIDISAHGGLMWSQEVRVLVRANALRHPALPEIVDGGFVGPGAIKRAGADINGFAFVTTRGSIYDLSSVSGITDHIKARPLDAMRYLGLRS